jgi:hypothetical protein
MSEIADAFGVRPSTGRGSGDVDSALAIAVHAISLGMAARGPNSVVMDISKGKEQLG